MTLNQKSRFYRGGIGFEVNNSHERKRHEALGDAEGVGKQVVEARMEDIALKALHIDDNPSLNPWTFRMFALGTLAPQYRLSVARY